LIEDSQADAVVVRETLRDAAPNGFQIESVDRLEKGLALLEQRPFDLVLLDLTLPDSYGIETFDRVQAEAEVAIVVLSGHVNDKLVLQALEHGAQDYLVKGTVPAQALVRLLRNAVTRFGLKKALLESEQRLRVLSEQLPAILWTTDADLRITSARGRGMVSLGLQEDQVIDQSVEEFFQTSNSRKAAVALHERALEGIFKSARVHWNGHWYHAHVEPLRNASDDVVGTIGVALDVTNEYRLERDVQAAHRIQQHLLPAASPKIRGFDISGACYAAEHCSGDFFDYIPIAGNRLAVVLADVSGHGFGPAIVAATIRSYLRTAAVLGNQVHEMLALGNRLLASDGDTSPFASAFTASLDPRTRTFQYSSAGHPAYLLRKNGDTQKLEMQCLPIGVRSDEVFPLSRQMKMEKGDILLIASDGVFETRRADREFLGVDRVLDVVREHQALPSGQIVNAIHRAACDFAGTSELHDDVTVVIVKAVSRRRPEERSGDTVDWPADILLPDDDD
jgi:PAS domain S-box-containing protein